MPIDDDVLRQADALEHFARAEPILWATHHAHSARALVRAARAPDDATLRPELRRLMEQARACELMASAHALEHALAGLDAAASG